VERLLTTTSIGPRPLKFRRFVMAFKGTVRSACFMCPRSFPIKSASVTGSIGTNRIRISACNQMIQAVSLVFGVREGGCGSWSHATFCHPRR
jgi:hypothetical protein